MNVLKEILAEERDRAHMHGVNYGPQHAVPDEGAEQLGRVQTSSTVEDEQREHDHPTHEMHGHEIHEHQHGHEHDHDFEKDKEITTSSSSERTTGVDVARAQHDFHELSKEMSHRSLEYRRTISRTASRRHGIRDIEKYPSAAEEERFDLEDTLRGNKALDDEYGIKSKRIGVLFEDLTVKGMGGTKLEVKTFPSAFIDFLNIWPPIKRTFGIGKAPPQRNILENFRGLVKPGEMCLVLGRPGSGCTSFLKLITNQRYGFTTVDGNVTYGPFSAQTFAKRFRGEATYNMEDDVHHATMTVSQTLGFALDLKTPGKRPAGVTKQEFKEKVLALLLKMFNIEHTANTVVGNPFVRGISGGERKRVSIAEMMISGSSVAAWDNTTRGLDASTATDYARSLRIVTNIYRTTTFVSLYQASETIYKQFDKVMVIDSGRMAYFGPANKARAYFEGLGFAPKPRQTTPDYLTGCTDPYERTYAAGFSEKNAPSDSAGLASAFLESEISKDLDVEIAGYKSQIDTEKEVYHEFETAMRDSKRKYTPKRSVYTAPFQVQVWALMKRQFLIKWQDKFSLFVSWATMFLLAILLGTVWLQLPKTSAGAFTRGGLLFLSLLFNAFQAFGELGAIMLGRSIVDKHRAFTFHQPSALWIAQIFIDLTFATPKIVVFSLLVYFLCGLYYQAGAFFIFVLVIVLGYLSMTLFFRTLGCLCNSFDSALRSAVVILSLFVLTSGYLIQYPLEQVWLRWIYYANTLGLGFAMMMINEFQHLDLTCISQQLIPNGAGYGDIAHQACTLSGATPGNPIVSGTAYIETAFAYLPSELWRNFGIIIAWIAFFLFLNVLLGEIITFASGGKTVTFFAKETAELKKLNDELAVSRDQKRQGTKSEKAALAIESKAVLTWEDLCYDVPNPGGKGELRLLNNIYGYVKPGQLVALMGASGAGKTTLLDVLAARKNIGMISGDVLVDGLRPGIAYQRGTSYAEQLDVHEPTQTVREALRFSATLRQPFSTPEKEKFEYVEEVIALLEMEDIADAIIGSPETGLAVEQRKRVTIGVELAAKPELLLFLDEPTSGLDSQSAFNIVRFLRKLAAAGQAILCTIHQPNSALFENFDRLLLLQKGGRCVYFGDIGQDAHVLREYLSRHGADCPSDMNPAEFMLDAIGAGTSPRIGDYDWADLWVDSEEYEFEKDEIARLREERRAHVGSSVQKKQTQYATPLWHQIKVVQKRTHLAYWRSPNYGFTRFFNQLVVALVTGFAYFQLDDSRSSLQYRVFIIFQVTVLPAFILAQVQPKYDMSRLIFYRESASKAYSQLPFALGMVMAEMPYSILSSLALFFPLYYIPGLQGASDRAGYQYFMVLITEIFSTTLGQMIAAITPSAFISAQLNPPIIITFSLFCGVTIPPNNMPGFWRAWLYQLDPLTRLIGGMVVTELQDQPVVCRDSEYNTFTSPPGQNCGEYMTPFFNAGGPGYIANNATSDCQYCAYSVGQQFFEPLGLDFSNRWRDLGILAAFIGSNLIILFIASRFISYNRR